MFQHIFWFFGHPEVYIILPALNRVLLPAFARKPLFGYTSMVWAVASIAVLSFVVWAHHMFTVGMPLFGQAFFMGATMVIAIPTGVKVFNWIATMWRGSMTFETPMLFAVACNIIYDGRFFRLDASNSARRLSVPRYVFCGRISTMSSFQGHYSP